MSTSGPLGQLYSDAAARFSEGDTAGFGEALADDCVFHANGGAVGSTAAEIVAGLDQARQATGWQTHQVLATTEVGDHLAVIAVNRFADGSSIQVAGGVVFRDGKIVRMAAAGGVLG